MPKSAPSPSSLSPPPPPLSPRGAHAQVPGPFPHFSPHFPPSPSPQTSFKYASQTVPSASTPRGLPTHSEHASRGHSCPTQPASWPPCHTLLSSLTRVFRGHGPFYNLPGFALLLAHQERPFSWLLSPSPPPHSGPGLPEPVSTAGPCVTVSHYRTSFTALTTTSARKLCVYRTCTARSPRLDYKHSAQQPVERKILVNVTL